MIQRANICVDSRFMGASGTSTSTITQPANLTAIWRECRCASAAPTFGRVYRARQGSSGPWRPTAPRRARSNCATGVRPLFVVRALLPCQPRYASEDERQLCCGCPAAGELAAPGEDRGSAGYHLHPLRRTDVDLHMRSIMESQERLWCLYGSARQWPGVSTAAKGSVFTCRRHGEDTIRLRRLCEAFR